MSKPKFSKGQIVYYNEEFRNNMLKNRIELLNRFSTMELGEMPINKLLIDSDPIKCDKTGTWKYQYVYGFANSEGYAKESDLISKEEFYRNK